MPDIDEALKAIGVTPDQLDPAVLSALRDADRQNRPTSLEDAYASHYSPGAQDARRKAAETVRHALLTGDDAA